MSGGDDDESVGKKSRRFLGGRGRDFLSAVAVGVLVLLVYDSLSYLPNLWKSLVEWDSHEWIEALGLVSPWGVAVIVYVLWRDNRAQRHDVHVVAEEMRKRKKEIEEFAIQSEEIHEMSRRIKELERLAEEESASKSEVIIEEQRKEIEELKGRLRDLEDK